MSVQKNNIVFRFDFSTPHLEPYNSITKAFIIKTIHNINKTDIGYSVYESFLKRMNEKYGEQVVTFNVTDVEYINLVGYNIKQSDYDNVINDWKGFCNYYYNADISSVVDLIENPSISIDYNYFKVINGKTITPTIIAIHFQDHDKKSVFKMFTVDNFDVMNHVRNTLNLSTFEFKAVLFDIEKKYGLHHESFVYAKWLNNVNYNIYIDTIARADELVEFWRNYYINLGAEVSEAIEDKYTPTLLYFEHYRKIKEKSKEKII